MRGFPGLKSVPSAFRHRQPDLTEKLRKHQGDRVVESVTKCTIRPIPDTPENIARAISKGPPKKHWNYIGRRSAADETPATE